MLTLLREYLRRPSWRPLSQRPRPRPLTIYPSRRSRFDQDGIFSRGNPGFSRGADFITPLVFAAYTLLLPPWEYYWLVVARKHNQPLYKRWSVSLTLGFTLAYAIISLWRVQNLPERVGGFLCGRVLGDGSCAEVGSICFRRSAFLSRGLNSA